MITAASARETLDVLPAWQPNVLVSDIGMPEEDGYSLIKKVRALSAEKGEMLLAKRLHRRFLRLGMVAM